MTSPSGNEINPRPVGLLLSRATKTCDWAALLVALAVAILFCIRPVGNADLGYHLAFGEHIWNTGDIVDTGEFIYTVDRNTSTLCPGQWWGDDGVLNFVCANWGTEVLMWWFYDNWGFDGLFTLRLILVCCIFILVGWLCLRLGMPASLGGVVMLVCSLAGYERFYLRPELFSYVLVLADLHIMLGLYMGRREILSWRKIVLLAVVQVLMVTMHSFFLLGWMVVSLPLVEAAGVWAWRRWRGGDAAEYLPMLRRLGIALGVVVLASFISPWPLRMFIYPFQVLLYLKDASHDSANPMSHIGELFAPFDSGGWTWSLVFRYYVISLSIVGAGCLCALYRRRWAIVMLMVLMVMQSLSMRRNIFASAIVMLPLAVACIWSVLMPVRLRIRNLVTLVIGVIAVTAGTLLAHMVVTDQVYFSDRRMISFGTGTAAMRMPLRAAAWVNEYQPVGRVWCDFDSSSNVMFFITPHPDVPACTNTFACPPSSITENQDYVSGKRPFDEVCEKYGIQIVILHANDFNRRLLETITHDPKFSLVDLDVRYALFIRNDGPNAVLAREKRITQANFDVDGYITYLRTLDKTKPAWAVQIGGMTLERMGWYTAAEKVFRTVITEEPTLTDAWFELGATLALRGAQLDAAGKREKALDDFRNARDCFVKALDIDPSYTYAAHNLRLAREDIQRLEIITGK